jgi:predicted phage-related endonuclease
MRAKTDIVIHPQGSHDKAIRHLHQTNQIMESEEKEMTERMIENRIRKLHELETQIRDLQQQADTIKSELKADLEEKGVNELKTNSFLIRWKEVISNRLDTKALKAALPDIYKQYTDFSVSRRFTII